ncbi:MAG: TIGR03790 family protein, partial [Gammaproteobacteria bacterium]
MPRNNSQGSGNGACRRLFSILLCLYCLTVVSACNSDTRNTVDLLPATLTPANLGVIVNDDDPLSRQIADYYIQKRGIPESNLVHIRMTPQRQVMKPAKFMQILAQVRAATPANVQAWVLTWATPYRVGCMSITTAFAAGYDEAFCAQGCEPTRASPYYDSDSIRPFTDYGWRPTMMLAGENFAAVKDLIDRGLAADGTRPKGTAYLLSTSNKARNGRVRFYPGIVLMQSDRFRLKIVHSDALRYRTDVMFYFTGLHEVEGIETNHYHPGAIADHLTSAGGKLINSSQMSSLEWLKAG